MRDALAGYKVPRRIRIVDEIPRLPNGKVDYPTASTLAQSATPDHRLEHGARTESGGAVDARRDGDRRPHGDARSSRRGWPDSATRISPTRWSRKPGRAFADFLGESLFVGATKPWGQAIAEFCADEGGGQPQATIIATGKKTLASRAALANGTMALGFEYADFGGGGRPYPFAVTAPLALAEARGRPGRDLVLGIVIGYEVMARVMAATFTGWGSR